MSALDLLGSVLSKMGSTSTAAVGNFDSILTKISGASEYDRSKYMVDTGRGAVSHEDLASVLRPIVYGEVSNRPPEKQELESRVILNTALNRIQEWKSYRGETKSLKDVLTEPNQYQAYQPNDPKSQYALYTSGGGNTLEQKKRETVDGIVNKLVDELKSGKFNDNTGGAYYYMHNEDGSIQVDNSRQLFKK